LFVIASPTPSGVVIQLEAHVASLLGMTNREFIASTTQASLDPALAMTREIQRRSDSTTHASPSHPFPGSPTATVVYKQKD
jgi:hypothetical protein